MITRIISGAVGIVIAAYVIERGGMLFAMAALVLALLTWFEFTRAFSPQGGALPRFIGSIGIAVLLIGAFQGRFDLMMLSMMAVVLLLIALCVFLHRAISVPDACIFAAGVFYIGLPFAHLILLRFLTGDIFITPVGSMDLGTAMVWVMFIGTWASDSFAYFTGRAFGAHPLAPVISPNKTVEGFLGGVVGTTAVIAGLSHLLHLPLVQMAGLGFATALLGTLGDLVECMMKRHTGIKDSGALIPGHGGMWDRFDSVLFTAPLVYYYTIYFVLR